MIGKGGNEEIMAQYKALKTKLRKQYLWPGNFKTHLLAWITLSDSYDIYRFLLHLRRYEYLITCRTTLIKKLQRFYNLRQYQKFSKRLGYMIGDGVLGDNVILYHKGSIIINPDAKIGEGCKFHGDCCIGVSHTGSSGCPTIGKNVDIGIGARILGDIYIADDIIIGANAVVTKSFFEPGITIAGIPAKKVKDAIERNVQQ